MASQWKDGMTGITQGDRSMSLDSPEVDRILASYHYELPPERIAQNPVTPRDRSRLLVLSSPTEHHHSVFADLPDWLTPGDLLVLNDTRVIPARLQGRKPTGAPVEALLLEKRSLDCWLALVKPGRRIKPGMELLFESHIEGHPSLKAKVLERDEGTGGRLLQFDVPQNTSLEAVLENYGQLPLPPYIRASQSNSDQYQTIYAKTPGAVAAPTAGLHFTPDLLQRLQQRGINHAYITLHVGVGTFRPVEVEDITTHKMHGEWLEVSPATVEQIQYTKSQGGRVIAVGTTVVRALEGAVMEREDLAPYAGKTEIFIYPGYQWKVVDGLITNFHLPGSSLLMLVSSMIGRSRLLNLYQEAIAQEYRFYSFGDAMLILPEARN